MSARMRAGNTALMVLGGLLGVGILAVILVFSYSNSYVAMDQEVKGAWAQVDNQLKRRADLIPNLVESVKGYASHEKEIFVRIAEARARIGSNASPKDKMEANNQLTQATTQLIAVAEAANPDLKAAPLFRQLMDELAGTENRLAVERQRYNEVVQKFNTAIAQVPGRFFAGALGYQPATYFEVPAAEKTAPKVSFETGAAKS